MADPNTDPFAEIGGGVKLADGGWVPKDHPLAQQAGAQPAGGGGAAAGGPAATNVQDQSANAQTYSNNPGGAPTDYTANQGTQDVVRNSWLQQGTQSTQIDTNDPNFRQQVDPFAAAQERGRRQYLSEQAEKMSAQGLGNSGAMQNEARFASERAGQATGAFESQLVTQELKNRRDEIQNALTNLSGLISQDQLNELKREAMELDAALKRELGSQQTGLGYAELGVKDKLGTGALNVDLMRALLQNQQFNTGQSLDWANFDWRSSPNNPANW